MPHWQRVQQNLTDAVVEKLENADGL
jgi:hypothetical protein